MPIAARCSLSALARGKYIGLETSLGWLVFNPSFVHWRTYFTYWATMGFQSRSSRVAVADCVHFDIIINDSVSRKNRCPCRLIESSWCSRVTVAVIRSAFVYSRANASRCFEVKCREAVHKDFFLNVYCFQLSTYVHKSCNIIHFWPWERHASA